MGSEEPLPDHIERQCCVYKTSCGATSLYLDRMPVTDADSPTGASIRYAYRRESNDDIYFGPSTEAEIRAFLVNDHYFTAAQR
ncbi:hypothetical protein [Arthrobacter sp. H14]|uniref:hypothetical protein n=1 Tax=Arthrobacter sp. H14 TaxID=1312959 RepID=UPI00047D45E9|nr:hypothetical protein [Arthrobacter sp. H14]